MHMKTKLKISKTSKMPCPSWSLEALTTCAGARNKNGTIVDACEICYARKNFYRMKPTINARQYNKQDWKRDAWVSDMVNYLNIFNLFRWFDGGDIYTVPLGEKIYQVCKLTPHCSHWIPSRAYKFSKFNEIFKKLKALPNVMVRFSSDSIQGEYTKGLHGSTIIPDPYFKTDAFVCKAYSRDGKCGTCRACWNKDIPLIAYPIH